MSKALLVIFLLLAFVGLATAQEGKKIAVIIGNDNYTTRPLKNAVNDARLMDKALQAAGFRTILRVNARKADMEEAMVELVEQIGPDDTALFFYAGHGVQIENENFLVPVDFESASSIARAKIQCFSMASVIEYLKRSRAKRTILVMDACRSNPVAESQSLQAGLAIPHNAGSETFIAFSTSPNRVAGDNPNGKNSWFTEALGDFIGQPGLAIEDVFMRVGKRVKDATNEQQTPWSQSSLTSKFYFRAPAGVMAENDPSQVEKWMDDARNREGREDWQEALDLVNQVLARKPGGMLEEMARRKVPYLTARRDAQTQFDSSDFAQAAKLYAQAVTLDPFALDAAFRGVNAHLLNDRLDEALQLLKAIRIRGTTDAIAKADAILKELAAVYPDAGQELQAGLRPPPELAELFTGFRFGTPDWEAGKRQMQVNPVDLARPSAQLAEAYPPPPPPAPAEVANEPAPSPSTPGAPVSLDALHALHVEVVSNSETRDFKIRKTNNEPVNSVPVARPAGVPVKVLTEPSGADLEVEGDPEQVCKSPCVLRLAAARQVIRARLKGFLTATRELQIGASGADLQIPLDPEYGFVQFDGLSPAAVVLVNGKQASRAASGRLQLPVGKYSIQVVQAGNVLSKGDLEVTPLTTMTMPVQQEPR